MPYAKNGQISTEPIEGGIKISEQQYDDALAGMLAGRIVTIDGGFSVIDPPEPPEPEPPEPEPPSVPQAVSRAQGKAALIQSGLWAQVLSYVDGIEDATQQALARVALDDTQNWQRSSPFLAQAAAAVGLGDAELDALFIAAAGIEL